MLSKIFALHLPSSPTHHVLVPIGGDGAFLGASSHYDGVDLVLEQLQSDPRIKEAKYSTPTRYLEAVSASLDSSSLSSSPLPLLRVTSNSLLRYSDSLTAPWSGHFSSRPYLKGSIRNLSRLLYASEMLHALANIHSREDSREGGLGELALSRHNRLKVSRASSAALQHHDVMSGTITSRVEEDLLNNAVKKGREAASSVVLASMKEMGMLMVPGDDYAINDVDIVGHVDDDEGPQVGGGEPHQSHQSHYLLTGSESLVILAGGGSGAVLDGYAQAGIGAILGRDGVVDLTVFNSLENNDNSLEKVEGAPAGAPAGAHVTQGGLRHKVRHKGVSVMVPCGIGGGEGGEWRVRYADGKGAVTSQLLPVFEINVRVRVREGGAVRAEGNSKGNGNDNGNDNGHGHGHGHGHGKGNRKKRGNSMRLKGERGKANVCRLVMAVEVGEMEGRRVRVEWVEWGGRHEEGGDEEGEGGTTAEGGESDTRRDDSYLIGRGLATDIVTTRDLARRAKAEGGKVSHVFKPEPTPGGDQETEAEAEIKASVEIIHTSTPKDGLGGVISSVATLRTSTSSSAIQITYRQFLVFPGLGTVSSGAYVQKWAGIGAYRVWGGWLVFYYVGVLVGWITFRTGA